MDWIGVKTVFRASIVNQTIKQTIRNDGSTIITLTSPEEAWTSTEAIDKCLGALCSIYNCNSSSEKLARSIIYQWCSPAKDLKVLINRRGFVTNAN